MRKPIRIIHLEDDPHDQEIVRRLLEMQGLDCQFEPVETRHAYESALEGGEWDLIMSDFTLPAYDGLSALAFARQKRPDVPYLFVSGTLGEEQAIESLKNGATDYVLKNHLERLAPAVRRALRETEERTNRQRAELLRETFFKLAQRLSSAITPEAAARIIVAVADELLGWDACTLDLYLPESDAVRPILMMETVLGEKVDMPFAAREHNLTARMRQCIEQGGQLILPEETEGQIEIPATDGGDRLAPSVLMVPVRHGPKVIGVLAAEKYTGPSYDRADLETLLALADHCGGALERIAISEEKVRLMTAVQAQQKRLDNLLASVPGVVWETWAKPQASAEQLNFVSPYVWTMLGYTVEEWLATPSFWLDIVHPEDKQRVSEQVGRMFANGKGGTHQCRWVAKDGRTVWVETGSVVICDENGKPLGLRGISIDITEKKTMEAQFLRSHRVESIGTLASGIAHDLNNILSPILLSAQLLRANHLDPESVNLLGLIETYAERGAQIVKRVLTFARGTDGEKKLLHPQQLLEEMLKIAAETFPKSITVHSNIPPSIWVLNGDATLLHQVLLNLCVNARDAMPEGGTLTLSADNILLDESADALSAKAGPYVVIEVADTGTGIPPELVNKIFDPFFTTKPQGQGTGLGLSTVLGIVKNHGGIVTVESAPDQGSRFKIFLPAVPDAKVEAVKPAPEAETPGHDGFILVVDDEDGIRTLAQRVLTGNGYGVLLAANGAEAVNIFKQRHDDIQLVLTDLRMPLMDGVSLVRALKDMKPRIKIIASSGFGEQKRIDELSNLSVTTFLDKPYTAEKLLAAIHNELREVK